MVKSNQIYSPQNYLCGVFGVCYFLKHKKHPADEIQDILLSEGIELWDYPLTEIDHIIKNNLDVVLVDCSHYEGDAYIAEYRWFEVAPDFDKEYDEEE